MNYVPKHSRDHADWDYVSHVEQECNAAGYRRSTLYISTDGGGVLPLKNRRKKVVMETGKANHKTNGKSNSFLQYLM